VVAKEEFEHAVDDVRRVDAMLLELLHDVEELPQDARAFRQEAGVCACAMHARECPSQCAAQAHTLL
jgi:hypothetical protein